MTQVYRIGNYFCTGCTRLYTRRDASSYWFVCPECYNPLEQMKGYAGRTRSTPTEEREKEVIE